MRKFRVRLLGIALSVGLGMAPTARAQFAVIDIAAIAQLVQQVATLQEQLTQAQREFEAMTGGRGMEGLLAGTVRNYLPPDWAQLEAAIRHAGGAYQVLAAQIQGAIDANAVLTGEQLALLAAEDRALVEAARQSAAMLQATARQALQSTSERFFAVQALIDAIAAAEDQKAILDLQARIAAEQGMLVNEQTKLDVFYRVAEAEEWARRQRTREQAITSVGSLRRLPAMGL